MLCLKGLEERKEQEAGNRKGVDDAANNLKVKWGLHLRWMVISEGQTICFLYIQIPSSYCFSGKECSLYPLQHINYEKERRGKSESQKAWPSLCNELNISGEIMLKFLCRGRVNSPNFTCYSGFTDVCYIALNCIIE